MSLYANPYQGDYKRVLCVCTMGMLRSPTAALVLAGEPYNFNTRSAGLDPDAITCVTPVLLTWAQEIVCFESRQKNVIVQLLARKRIGERLIKCLDIPDRFPYRDSELIKLIQENYPFIDIRECV